MRLEPLRGRRKSKRLEGLIEQPLVVELSDGKAYGGRLHEYYDGTIYLYSCSRLDKKGHKWIKLRSGDGEFSLADITDIFVLPKTLSELRLELDDVLHMHIDPYYKPLIGIECDWRLGEERPHCPQCDAPLHEALTFLRTATYSASRNEEERRRRSEGFDYIRRRLLNYGARIP
jgi:hypothetical protein